MSASFLLALANVLLACALTLWPYWFSTRILKLAPLNPFTIIMFLSLPVQIMKLVAGPLVLIDDGIEDVGYQYALTMGNLLVVAQTAGLWMFYRMFEAIRIDTALPLRNLVLGKGALRRSAAAAFLIYWAAFLLMASAEFGVLNWLTNPREGYQAYRTGQGHWYAIATSALALYMLLSFLVRPRARSLLLRAPLLLGMAYLLGSKGLMLGIFGSLLVFLWFVRWKHFGKMFFWGTPLVFALLVWNLFLAISDAFEFQAVLEYFDYYKNAADYYRAYLEGEIRLFGGEIMTSSYWAYVPRALWPEKPVVYGILIVNEIFYPGQAELTNTPAFGGAVEQFADFGIPGVLVLGFFSSASITTALFSYLIFKRPGVSLERVTLPAVLVLLMQFVPAFGTFFPGLLYFLLLLFVALLIATLRLRARRTASASRVPPTAPPSADTVLMPPARS